MNREQIKGALTANLKLKGWPEDKAVLCADLTFDGFDAARTALSGVLATDETDTAMVRMQATVLALSLLGDWASEKRDEAGRVADAAFAPGVSKLVDVARGLGLDLSNIDGIDLEAMMFTAEAEEATARHADKGDVK